MNLIASLKNSYLRGELIFALDTVLSLMASLLAIFGVSRLVVVSFYSTRFLLVYLSVAVVATLALFLLARTFRIIIRHLSVRDVIPFALVAIAKCVLVVLALLAFGIYSKAALLIAVIDLLLTLALLLGVRVCMILVYDAISRKQQDRYNKQQVLVYGTSDKSVATIKRLQHSTHYQVNGFIERSENNRKYLLERLPVYCFSDDSKLDHLILDKKIDAILFARDTDAQSEADRLLAYCSKYGIKTLIVPNVDEVAEGESLLHPRDVKVEDLLGRKEIAISLNEIKANFHGKVVLVTGAAGSIGSELVRQLATFGVQKIVLFDNGETALHNLRLELEDKFRDLDFVPVIGDVRYVQRLDYVFRTWHPQVVFHAAAYKHVPLMEENPCEAVLVNLYGTKNVADKCLEYGVEKMVMISTDKAVNPTNVMGCSKRLAEIYVQSLGKAIAAGKVPGTTQFVTTRFGNVLGSNGSVIPRFREQIEHGGPVTVTDPNITRYFMTIPEACRLVMEAATLPTENRICVFDMGQPVKIDTLARRMIELAGLVPDQDIDVVYTGLRPGEKLYEEVLSNKENTDETSHDRIRIARVREYEYADAVKAVEQLETLSRAVRIPEMVKLMKEIVPEYISNNSRFEAYDKK